MKVLLSAYACEPRKGSEPEVGWNAALALARRHEVWVLTRSNNRSAIEREVVRDPVQRLYFVYSDLPPWARWWKRGSRGMHLYYYAWQIGAYFVARRLHRRVHFDIIHHVTFGKYWVPSLLALLPVPFVWGPVGGGESTPGSFWRDLGMRGRLYEAMRTAGRWVGEHDPFVRMTARRSTLALAKTEATAERLRALGAREVHVFSEAGLSRREIEDLASYPVVIRDRLRFVTVARLLGWKGVHLGLRAFAQAALAASEYWIVGDGPERKALRAQARALGIADRVRFWGRLDHDAMWRTLGQADILLHPSLHDSGGDICLEAMAAGRPVICLDLGGPALQVTEETGFKIPASTPNHSVSGLAAAMRRMASDPELRRRMAAAGRRWVQEVYPWEVKGPLLAAMYPTRRHRGRDPGASVSREPAATSFPSPDV